MKIIKYSYVPLRTVDSYTCAERRAVDFNSRIIEPYGGDPGDTTKLI